MDIIYTLHFVPNIRVKEEKTQFLRGHNSWKRADMNGLSADWIPHTQIRFKPQRQKMA